ncbi:MAG: ABC transporter ATP-binding protein [Rhodobacterales bacterium 32-66-7]|nr:MAG: ABC transporter ATP-binding protein [Rhodobacterales bacterium 32-66-7]
MSDPAFDADEARRARNRRIEGVARWALPLLVVLLTLWAWDWFSNSTQTRGLIFPEPAKVWARLLADRELLFGSLLVTLRITFLALGIAVMGGVLLAILFTQSRFAELVFFPYAVVLQVTPIVSIAPLIFIYVQDPLARVLICAWIVAFFPILSNTTLGLKSTDRNLVDLYAIYGASWWQRLLYLQLPSSLPYFLGGLRIAGGLALIGAIVAEYVAGISGSASGLAFRILEASYRLNYPRMFAALILIAVVGVLIFAATSFLSWLLLRKWHESALGRES